MSSATDPAAELPDERHSVPSLSAVHTGDVCRVTSRDGVTELDPASAIAVWPYTQGDFDEDHHSDDIKIKEYRRKDLTAENPELETVREPKPNGVRVTFETPRGDRYAVVNWGGTPDPAFIYLLVIESEDPDIRRWCKVGTLDTLERYGPRVSASPEYAGRMPSEDIPPWDAEQDAEPEFSTLGGVHELDDSEVVDR